MTAQEIFDHVLAHLREQGRTSADVITGNCRYLSPEGLQCAVGCLLERSEYHPNMENKTVEQLHWQGLLPEALQEHVDLLSDLQEAHDYQLADCVEAWEVQMGVIARMRGLAYQEAA